jgi:hypothetical protein
MTIAAVNVWEDGPEVRQNKLSRVYAQSYVSV